MNTEVAKDLLELVNSLKGFAKSKEVKYGSTSFHYTPLDDLLEKIKESKKFSLLQPIYQVDGVACIENILVHESGAEIKSGAYPLLINGSKMQDMGAVITYSRRYSLSSFLGIATEEDNDATDQKPVDVKATPKQVDMLAKNYTGENLAKLLEANNITKLEDLPMKKASELISKIMAKKEGTK